MSENLQSIANIARWWGTFHCRLTYFRNFNCKLFFCSLLLRLAAKIIIHLRIINNFRNYIHFLRRCHPTHFLDHTQRRTTVGRTPLEEWSAHRGDLYLTTHNNHNRQTSMPPGGIRTHNLSRRAAADSLYIYLTPLLRNIHYLNNSIKCQKAWTSV